MPPAPTGARVSDTLRRTLTFAYVCSLVLGLGSSAEAHLPPVAWLTTPAGVGEVVDDAFMIEWTDNNGEDNTTSVVTFSFYYTAEDPNTFPLGYVPDDLTGELIAEGIPQEDPENRLLWDTSNVPAGTYRLWSIAEETPPHPGPLLLTPLSLGVVTVAHPGDPVFPALSFTVGPHDYVRVDESFTIDLSVFDPDGTGTLLIEASPDGETWDVIAEDVPASNPSIEWQTKDLAEGNWSLRATITDARGLSFRASAQCYIVVLHIPTQPAEPETEDEPVDTPPAPAPERPSDPSPTLDDGAGGCAATRPAEDGAPFLMFLLFSMLRSRRRTIHRRKNESR